MKKVLSRLFLAVMFCAFLSASAFSQETQGRAQRYIVFFASTPAISAASAARIKTSQNLRITFPLYQTRQLSQDLSELIFGYHKAEPAFAFNPEPYFPLLTSSYRSDDRAYMRSLFAQDFNNFFEKTSYRQPGIFLTDALVCQNTLEYFELLNASWTVASNITNAPASTFRHGNITVFAPYTDFPTRAADIERWLAARPGRIIPVLLSSAQLNNAQFMGALASFFDRNTAVMPVTPLYIARNIELAQANNLNFELVDIPEEFRARAYMASEVVSRFRRSVGTRHESYNNVRNELQFLYSYELLSGLLNDSAQSRQMYDIAFNNIFRFLGTRPPEDGTAASVRFAGEDARQVTVTSNSVAISGDGPLRRLTITNARNTIDFDIDFIQGAHWPITISYIDVYISLPHGQEESSVEMHRPTHGIFTGAHAWNYLVRIFPDNAVVYRHYGGEVREIAAVPILNRFVARIPKPTLDDDILRWSVQAISVNTRTARPFIVDFFNRPGTSKEDALARTPFNAEFISIR